MKVEVREIYPKLRKIESEIQTLKVLVIKSRKVPLKKVTLEGLLKGVKVEEKDIEEAKKAVFKFGA